MSKITAVRNGVTKKFTAQMWKAMGSQKKRYGWRESATEPEELKNKKSRKPRKLPEIKNDSLNINGDNDTENK